MMIMIMIMPDVGAPLAHSLLTIGTRDAIGILLREVTMIVTSRPEVAAQC